jgi:chromosome segregation ATPase
MADANADFKQFSDEMYQLWEQSMTSWWDQVLDSPEFLGASGKGLSQMAAARRAYEHQMDEQLTRMHLPTRGDVTRLARIATLLEERLLKTEDTVLELKDTLDDRNERIAQLEKEVLQARVEATEARVELRETLAALTAKLDALAAAKPAPAPAQARTPRARANKTDPAPPKA